MKVNLNELWMMMTSWTVCTYKTPVSASTVSCMTSAWNMPQIQTRFEALTSVMMEIQVFGGGLHYVSGWHDTPEDLDLYDTNSSLPLLPPQDKHKCYLLQDSHKWFPFKIIFATLNILPGLWNILWHHLIQLVLHEIHQK